MPVSPPNIDNLILSDTPWEKYTLAGHSVYVKREDLCCVGGPQFSKIRGLIAHLQKLPSDTPVATLDTIHSKGGWGTAYICKELGMPCFVFYPGVEPRVGQIKAAQLGATLLSLKPGRSAILWYRARKHLAEITEGKGYLLPNGLQLEESRKATYLEALHYTPKHLFSGTWIVSISTGTIAAGVAQALPLSTELIIHLGYSRSHNRVRKVLGRDITIVDEGYDYKDSVDFPCPFPCNSYYDLKAWKWLAEHLDELKPPVVFWNIGA